MDEYFEITDDERNDVIIMAAKISSLGGFIRETEPDDFPDSEGIYCDMGQLLHEASRDILNIMNDIEGRYLDRKRDGLRGCTRGQTVTIKGLKVPEGCGCHPSGTVTTAQREEVL